MEIDALDLGVNKRDTLEIDKLAQNTTSFWLRDGRILALASTRWDVKAGRWCDLFASLRPFSLVLPNVEMPPANDILERHGPKFRRMRVMVFLSRAIVFTSANDTRNLSSNPRSVLNVPSKLV